MATPQPVLSRIFVTADCSIKAVYSDNSLFLLTKDGSTFTSVDSHGNCVTQLTLYAISRYKPKLAEVIAFRNLHVGLVLTTPSLHSNSYCLGYRVTSVRWSLSPASAESEGLLRFEPDGSIVLDSEDSAARVVLHANRNRIAVCYPLLLPGTDTSKHHYIWQTQLFAVAEAPRLWQYPLRLLQQASTAHADDTQKHTQAALSFHSKQACEDRDTELPVAVSPGGSVTTFPKQSWWLECSHMLPQDITVLLEWAPEALYQYMPSTDETAVWIHADESCLLSEGKGSFVKHCRGRQHAERLYAATAVPLHTSAEGTARYPLAQFAEHALAIRQLGAKGSAQAHMQAQKVSQDAARKTHAEEDTTASQLVCNIHEQHQVADCGEFTAYEDGSIHVAFQDRTLLYMKASHTHCDVITPDGHRVTVATATPVGVEQYVEQAMEFAEWAFSTPAQRAAVLQTAASIQKELGKCQRAAALCDWAQGHQLYLQGEGTGNNGDSAIACADSFSTHVKPSPSLEVMCHLCPASSGREQMIQALLARSNLLLSTLI